MMEFAGAFILLTAIIVMIYSLQIGVFTIGICRKSREQVPRSGSGDFVSVIIAVRNEEANMARILGEMLHQDFSRDLLEIIVADDHSEDETMAKAGLFAEHHPELSVIPVPSEPAGMNAYGKKKAIGRAVAKAKGAILLFTDADTFHETSWITSMVSGFENPRIQMVLGPVYFCRERNALQKIQALEFLGLMGTTAGSAAMGYPVMCNGANLAYRRSAFELVGGFSSNFAYSSGDDQFMMSAVRNHYGNRSLVFNLNKCSSVGTEAESTLAGFLNQLIRWVSKSRGYSDPVVIAVGIFTYLTHLMLLCGFVLGIFLPEILPGLFVLWLVKILLEFPMVAIMARFFGKYSLLGYYLPAQVFQLIYVPVAGLLGLVLPYRWKGRRS